jgi:hypothetical protein
MPSAPEELKRKFPNGEQEALSVLSFNFDIRKGIIMSKYSTHKPTHRELDAIDYLFLEWDYVYWKAAKSET